MGYRGGGVKNGKKPTKTYNKAKEMACASTASNILGMFCKIVLSRLYLLKTYSSVFIIF